MIRYAINKITLIFGMFLFVPICILISILISILMAVLLYVLIVEYIDNN